MLRDEGIVPLVFVPELSSFFLHGERSILASMADRAPAHTLALVVPPGVRRRVRGVILSRDRVIERLASVSSGDLDALPGSIAAYALASKFVLDLVAREHVDRRRLFLPGDDNYFCRSRPS